MSNKKFRLDDVETDMIGMAPGIIREYFIKSKKEDPTDLSHCSPHCTCNIECKCDKQCNHCKCVDNCNCESKCTYHCDDHYTCPKDDPCQHL